MKRLLAVFILGFAFILGCGSDASKVVKLVPDTPEYELAKSLSEKLSILDPDSNKIIVTGKKFKISAGELVEAIQSDPRIPADRLQQMDAARLGGMIKRIAQDLVEKKLLLAEVNRLGIKIQDAQVDSILEMQYTRFGGQEKFEEMIGQQGFDLDFVKNDIKTGLGIQKAIQKAVDDSLEIDDEQMQKEYEDYTSKEIASVRHILMQTTGKNDSEKAEIRKKMEGLLDRAKAGEDFAALAEEFTEDPGSKATGGLYEEFGKGQMVKPFEDAAFTVPVGEISDIVETRYGYHIIKVINRNSYKSFDEKREELLEKMRNQQAPKIQRDYIERLKTEADINIAEIA